ncbi:hypothetical protein L596_000936 [Steinernema carpocapsae]|uniref:Uncharacterized protein n=1 Tax=Steinernema carpocapsae TaxID=34508 RepID=A0A4U8UK52_STECR|nr:hypothetical protein L596_000936 [Steinernema carpocapsae]
MVPRNTSNSKCNIWVNQRKPETVETVKALANAFQETYPIIPNWKRSIRLKPGYPIGPRPIKNPSTVGTAITDIDP